jgi:hypothetical protein
LENLKERPEFKMADDISSPSVGSNPVYFPLMPNWQSIPKLSFAMPRSFVSYPGTAQMMISTTELTPIEFTLDFMVDNKSDEYDLLEFFHYAKGRAKRFWIEHPVSLFDLTETMTAGSGTINVLPNDFQRIAQDDERIFIAMKNGDLIVRTVTNSVLDGDGLGITLTLNEVINREIATDGYWLIGRFLLCRLKEDGFKQSIESSEVTTYSIGFVELPYEMAEQGAS